MIKNIFTCDVEDYFQVESFSRVIKRDLWDQYSLRVVENTRKMLQILKTMKYHGTFFFLGWIAERCPDLVLEVAQDGHEIGCHGYWHRPVYEQTPLEFRDDVMHAKKVIEGILGRTIDGYRAPSFSIVKKSLWALDILLDLGFKYDSSIFPVYHDRYGIADAPREIHTMKLRGGQLWECPPSTFKSLGINVPVAGGGYFRLLPFQWILYGMRKIEKENIPLIFYIHPWELDPDQPRIRTSFFNAFRHYYHLKKTEERLKRLFERFQFCSVRDFLSETFNAAA